MDAEPQEQTTTVSAGLRPGVDERASRRLLRWSAVLSAGLAVPLLPLIVLGLSFEERIESLLDVQMTAAKRFWMIAGLLSVDLVLPVPSSALSTYGGGRIGLWPAFAASFLGMTTGATIGYAISSWLGEPIARRLAGEADFDRMRRLTSQIGPYALLLTRPLPILAEASVLLAGAARLPPRRFFPPVLAANAAVSFIYALFGATFRSEDALPVAIGVAAVLPMVVAIWIRRKAGSTRRVS